MSVRLALAGDTMLGRGVAEKLATDGPGSLFSEDLIEVVRDADLFVLNLECCISERGERWPDPHKPFFFRAPPSAVDALMALGVDCVTLANNHALDFGVDALDDTIGYLTDAGIAVVGAGPDIERARAPVVLEVDGFRLAIIAVTDHPAEFAATEGRPGVAFADLRAGVPGWLTEAISAADADAVLVSPHWGPNMVAEPLDHVVSAGRELASAGATLVAGHSAHVFHGARLPIIYDLGDFIDDYAVDPVLRNNLGLLFVVTLDRLGPTRLEAIPIELEYCHTRLARGEGTVDFGVPHLSNSDEARWIGDRFTAACGALGSVVTEENGRLVMKCRKKSP